MAYGGIKLGANRVVRKDDGAIEIRHECETPDDRDYRFEDSKIFTCFRPVVASDSVDWLVHVEDMGFRVQIANDCVAYDLAQKAWLCAAIQGHRLKVFPSVLAPYAQARLLGDPPKRPGEPILTDWGSGCRFAMQASGEVGLVDEARWPELAENVNVVPPADVYHQGACATVEGYYRIADGESASSKLFEALRRGYAPGFCMVVDQAFADLRGDATYVPGGKALGGHAQTIAVYDAPRDRFGAISTWGRDHGHNGILWVPASYINRHAYDMWVVQVAPEALK